jgi:hypothetical protein
MALPKLGSEVAPDPGVVDAVAQIDRETLTVSARLRAANEADIAIPLPELAAIAERDVERSRYLVEVGVIPPEFLDDAILRARRIRNWMARRLR